MSSVSFSDSKRSKQGFKKQLEGELGTHKGTSGNPGKKKFTYQIKVNKEKYELYKAALKADGRSVKEVMVHIFSQLDEKRIAALNDRQVDRMDKKSGFMLLGRVRFDGAATFALTPEEATELGKDRINELLKKSSLNQADTLGTLFEQYMEGYLSND